MRLVNSKENERTHKEIVCRREVLQRKGFAATFDATQVAFPNSSFSSYISYNPSCSLERSNRIWPLGQKG